MAKRTLDYALGKIIDLETGQIATPEAGDEMTISPRDVRDILTYLKPMGLNPQQQHNYRNFYDVIQRVPVP